MKILIAILLTMTIAHAAEVTTDCPAMNHSREKIVKEAATKKARTRTQVLSQ